MYCIDEDFAQWAFGKIWHKFMVFEADSKDLMHAWNELHGRLLHLEGGHFIDESMDKMKQLWREHGQLERSNEVGNEEKPS